jgi:diguanylate cyclase (GGDEF)-like protein
VHRRYRDTGAARCGFDMSRTDVGGQAALGRMPGRTFRLTRFFSLTSVTGLVLVTIGLIWVFQVVTLRLMVEHESRANADLTRAFANTVWRNYSGYIADSRGRSRETLLADPAVQRLRADVVGKMGGLRIAKVKIYNIDGVTVFSTDERQIGEVKADNAGFVRARRGEIASAITFRDQFDTFEGVVSGRNLIYSYIPVRAEPDSPVEGVFEVYSDVTDLIAEQKRARLQIAGLLVGALAALYLFLLVVVRRADRVIARHEVERSAHEAEIHHQARHDPLTGLPNRMSFSPRLTEAVAQARASAVPGALLFIDLDHFKDVNDSIGHDAGDRLLKAVAERIRRCLRSHDVLFRMGGDEFTAILPRVASPDHAAYAARRINQTVAAPFHIDGTEVRVGATIGIAVFPDDGESPEDLLRNADAAMYTCKACGRGSHAFYQASMNARAAERQQLEAELRQALATQQFRLHYQPRVDALTRRVVGVEALLRWEHPAKGLLLPANFLPTLDGMALITEVGEWVLRTAAAQLREWHDRGLGHLHLSVNVSGRQFQHVQFAQMVSAVLRDTQVPPGCIELELTESLLIPEPDTVCRTLEDLRALGVRLAIDDFGAGISSIERLRTLPVHILKIDRILTAEVGNSDRDRAIAAAIASLGRALGITVVVEAVETDGQARFFTDIGCGELQGYLFSQPLPADQIEAFCSSRA